MIDRHAVQALVQSGLSTKDIAAQMGIPKYAFTSIDADSSRQIKRTPLSQQIRRHALQRIVDIARSPNRSEYVQKYAQFQKEKYEGPTTFS